MRTEYVGGGPAGEVAELAARLDEALAAEECVRLAEARGEAEAEDAAVGAVADGVEAVVAAALRAAGYRRHRKGQWRRARMGTEAAKSGPAKMPAPREEIIDVMTRASKGDRSALPRLREILDADPGRLVRAAGGDLAQQVEMAIVAKLVGVNLSAAEAIPRQLEALRRELAGESPTAIERLLADRAVLCWLDAHALDLRQADQSGGQTFRQAADLDRRRTGAHKRLLSSLRALAAVRKLDLVAIQVLIDQRKVVIDDRPGPSGLVVQGDE